MWGVAELLQGVAAGLVDEALRYAYVASRLAPGGLFLTGAAVAAGLVGAAAIKRIRALRHRGPVPGARPVSWTALATAATLLPALAAGGLPSLASADVLCRTGQSRRLVLRADGCRRRERIVGAAELGMAQAPVCEDAIAALWQDVRELRVRLESARTLAMQLEAQAWPDGEAWLAIHGIEIEHALTRLERRLEEFGMTSAGARVGSLRDQLRDGWSRPVEACTLTLAFLPDLEAALPVLPAAEMRP